MEPFVDVKELEVHFGLKPSWWYQAVAAKRVPFYKVGGYVRFKISEIERWFEAQRQGPRSA